jgi:pimeloyl-ACP methyl ester carboxylesterase
MAQEVSNSIVGSKLVIIPFAGHTLNLEAIPQMNLAILNFMKSV